VTLSGKQTGFTLIELLVVSLIFAVIGVMAYSGLRSVIDSGIVIEEQASKLRRLQLAVQMIDQDIRSAVSRPVRDEFGDPEVALRGRIRSLDLTSGGWSNPNQLQRSELRRVSLRLINGQLQRLSWPVLDRTQSSQPLRQTLLSEIDDLSFQFLDDVEEWQDQWPPPLADQSLERWPRAVRWQLISEDYGQIERVLRLVVYDES